MNAVFSDCRNYRYTLWRQWSGWNYVNFVCLNPSTADETKDDNTIRKCVKFAKSWGYGAMCVTNLFAYRSTDPKVMLNADDPVGAENDYYIREIAGLANLIVVAWGRHGLHLARSMEVKNMLSRPIYAPLHYLRMSEKTGQPWHPLYLPDTTKPIAWLPAPRNASNEDEIDEKYSVDGE